MERASGILMHLSSLPSPYGIGTLGAEARQFVDFLALSGQRYWQMLPIGPTSYGILPINPSLPLRATPILSTWSCSVRMAF